jgi:hypothetical protein
MRALSDEFTKLSVVSYNQGLDDAAEVVTTLCDLLNSRGTAFVSVQDLSTLAYRLSQLKMTEQEIDAAVKSLSGNKAKVN